MLPFMKTFIAISTFVFLMFALLSTSQAFQSPFTSGVKGLTIPNSHILLRNQEKQPLVLRGMAPDEEQIGELKDLGVEKVLIFKNETRNEVQKEIEQLRDQGIRGRDVKHIPFPWKDLDNFEDSCRMTIEALQFIEEAVEQDQAVYFHCTVGEDRTGYLAGLFQIWQHPEVSPAQVFEKELCGRGYEAGNAKKPRPVVSAIRATLTPTFMKMASLLQAQREQGLPLDQSLCSREAPAVKKIWSCR